MRKFNGAMRNIAIIAVVILTGFTMTACATKQVIFDESLTSDKYALVRYVGVNIVEYNGVSVEWGGLTYWDICIPGGETIFVLNGKSGSVDSYTMYNNVPFKYNFENGKEYSMWVTGSWINIHSGTDKSNFSSFSSDKNHIVTFYMSNKGQTITHLNGKKVD